MGKTVFTDGDPSQGVQGTIVSAAWLNAISNHRHDGADQDGSAPLNYAADTGAADAYAIALTPALTAHVPGMPILFKAANANTGASTIAINGLAAAAIKNRDGSDLQAGQIEAGAVSLIAYDGVNYELLSGASHAGNLLNIQVFSASGTYSPTAGTKSVLVEAVGGGGAGGGVPTTGSSQNVVSPGGNSGAYGRGYFDSGFDGGLPVTAGAGGVAVSGAAGGNGGTSSFGALMSCPGGAGGPVGVTSNSSDSQFSVQGSSNSAPAGANIISSIGERGGIGLTVVGGSKQQLGGKGGASFFGPGPEATFDGTTGSIGVDGSTPGAGGSGAGSGISIGNAKAGGNGAAGLVIVYEFG